MSTNPHNPEALLADLDWMRRLAVKLVTDPTTAEDLVQETWLAALKRRWPTGRPTRAWLSKVIRNQAVNRYRSESRRRDREEQSARPEAVSGQPDVVARLEAQQKLAAAVLELEEPTRTILLLRFQEEMQPAEIAKRLDLPAGTVRSRISRALHLLRGKLEQRMGGDYRAALAPILSIGLGKVGTGVTGATLAGAVTMKKILIASAAAASVLTVLALEPWKDTGGAEPVSETASAVPKANDRKDGESGAVVSDPARAELAGIGAKLGFGNAGGWWLEGSIRAANGFGDTLPVVTVRDLRGRNPLALFGKVDKDGRAELDLARLFRHEILLTRGVRVQVDHPDYLPAYVAVGVTRRQRQDGFLGKRSRVPFQMVLTPATARVTGAIELPDGVAENRVRVALFRASGPGSNELKPVDHGTVQADGSFALRAIEGGRYKVVAWAPSGDTEAELALRPQTLMAVAGTGAERRREKPLRFELDAGATIRGHVRVPGIASGVRFRLTASTMTMVDTTVSVLPHVEYDDVTGVAEVTEVTDELVSDPISELAAAGPEAFGVMVDDIAFRKGPAAPIVEQAAPFVDLGGLAFSGSTSAGGGFALARLHAWVGPDGRFTISGLAHGSSCTITDLEPFFGGLPLHVQSVGEGGEGLNWDEVSAPAENVEIEYRGHLVFLRFTLDGNTVVPQDAAVLFDESEWSMDTDGRGRVALSVGGEVAKRRLGFRVPVCEKVEADVRAGIWNHVDLRRPSDLATLTVHLSGDSGRNVEALHFTLRKIEDGGRKHPVELLHHPVHKRFDSRLVLRDIPSGRYELRVLPFASLALIDFGTFTQTVVREVELAPGPQNFLNVALEPAGFLELESPREFLSKDERKTKKGHVQYRILDSRGKEIPSSTVYATLEPDVVSTAAEATGRLRFGHANRFTPLLAPGNYTLETWTVEQPEDRRRTPFRIDGGAVTILDARKPKAK